MIVGKICRSKCGACFCDVVVLLLEQVGADDKLGRCTYGTYAKVTESKIRNEGKQRQRYKRFSCGTSSGGAQVLENFPC